MELLKHLDNLIVLLIIKFLFHPFSHHWMSCINGVTDALNFQVPFSMIRLVQPCFNYVMDLTVCIYSVEIFGPLSGGVLFL